ncbi:glycoside hydrolase domain-containing protein [Grimontia sp. AD028]|uniref:glycoside hydrolase domain-containing protein n=1 Tax=Grimontia sp. AD028 TaxID=1581149 RepID=UPI000696AA6A|nr:glycoside hydrolase domain-containing protein [Grimontia sp. AD028]
MNIIDTPWNTSSKLSCLSSHDVKTVIRYYNFSNSSGLPEKCLTLAEAEHICSQGMTIATVFQQRQNQLSDFTKAKGLAAGKRAYTYARDSISQPENSAIYFAVDFDASKAELNSNIIPYFEGVDEAFSREGGESPEYRIGVYGSGLVGKTLSNKNLVSLVWLSMSRGFRGTKKAYKNGEYDLCQIPPATQLCGLGVDFNEVNPNASDFGDFSIDYHYVIPSSINRQQGSLYRVIARQGLRLRGGPGTHFDVIGGLRSGQTVNVASVTDGWARVDIEGDGQVDGFASSVFLEHV